LQPTEEKLLCVKEMSRLRWSKLLLSQTAISEADCNPNPKGAEHLNNQR
jgi:hypothetical protein